MAEVLYKANMGDRQDDVQSCGTGAEDGCPASSGSVKAVTQYKDRTGRALDLTKHKSQALSRPLLEWADLVLTTDWGRSHSIKRFSPDDAFKVFTIGEFIRTNEEVPDPIGGTAADYKGCAQQLDDMTKQVVKRLNDIESEQNHG